MVLLLSVLLSLSFAFAQDRLYVVQGSDESLGQISLTNGQVTTHVLDLGLWCNDIVVHGTRLFVANSGDNTVQEIDAVSNTTVRNIPLTTGINPWSLAFPNNDTLAVTCWVSRNVVLLRYSDGAEIGSVSMPTGPEGITVIGDRVFVCETGVDFPNYNPGKVRVYDRHSWQLLDSMQVGVNAQFAAADDLGRLHVVCTGDYATIPGTIHILNLQSLTVDTVLAIGGTPNTVSFGAGFAFVAAGGFGDAGYVYKYRLDDFEILNDAGNPITTGPGATDLEAASDGSFYVSCMQVDEVRHHALNGALIAAYPVSDGPGYLTFYPAATTDVRDRPAVVPADLQLVGAYPNPFNGDVTLRFETPVRSPGEVRIVNELGQEVTRLHVGAGANHLLWAPTGLTSGNYYVMGGGSAIRVIYLK